MSIRSLTSLAIERDRAKPGAPAAQGGQPPNLALQVPAPGGQQAPPAAQQQGGGPAAPAGVPQSFADVLISVIPTEPLAAYTALVGVAVGAVDTVHRRDYLPFRWWCFLGFLALTLLAIGMSYMRGFASPPSGQPSPPQSTMRKFPWAEGGAAIIAAAAWGLAMPGSALNVQLSGTVRTLTIATIIVVSAAVLTLVFAPQLKSGTSKQ